MKRNRKSEATEQDNSQNSYAKTLNSLLTPVSEDYSKLIKKDKRAIVLGYDC